MYSTMWRSMERGKDEAMVSSNQAGIDRVLQEQGSYAFFMESTTIEYQTEKDCRLKQIGGELDSKSYGVALPQGNLLSCNLSKFPIFPVYSLQELMYKRYLLHLL